MVFFLIVLGNYSNSVIFFLIVLGNCTNSVVCFVIVLGNCTNSVVFFVIYFITRYKTHSELVASKKKKPGDFTSE